MRISEPSANDHDASRVLRIKKRDPDALAELIDQHSYTMLRLANAIVRNRDAAKDIVQDVFMALWTRADTLNIQGDVRGYLWAATRNHARMVLRHELVIKRHQESSIGIPLDTDSANPNLALHNLDREDFLKQVTAVLDGLPPRCREIFLLHWRDDLTYPEIASALELSVATVRNQIARAMREIIQVIKLEK